MWARLGLKDSFKLGIVSCGDAGQEIGAAIITLLQKHGKESKNTLAINSGKRSHPTDKYFRNKVSISENHEGFARDLDRAKAESMLHMSEIQKAVEKIIPDKNGFMIITTGAGATGISAALLVIQILKEYHNLTPPVFMLLPDSHENSRVQYNAAQFIYETVYSKNPWGNPVILLDNNPAPYEEDLPFETISRMKIETIPRAIANLIYSSFMDPITEEYNTSFNDLMEVLNTSGVGTLVYRSLINEDGQLNTRFDSIINDHVTANTNLTLDEIATSRRVYIAVINAELQQSQFIFEATKIKTMFRSYSPHVIFANTEDESISEPAIYGLVMGIPLPPRIVKLMQVARDSRKKIIYREYVRSTESFDLSTETVFQLEEEILSSLSKYD